ncbi:uncharacterized protein DMENIID0001_021570 [Sergentomyia squamirostris]
MSFSSHTGLIASQPRTVHRMTQQSPSLRAITNICAVTQRAPLVLRPFAAIYNPYSKSCSVLCNHPATPEVKNVVKLAKQSWKTEAVVPPGGQNEDVTVVAAGRRKSTNVKMSEYDLPENVPEELFRRFTDTDSRPMTPTPTVISTKTRVSVSSIKNSRRCVTPEPKTICASAKKRLILDLRRSHSQETIFWNAPSDLSPAPGASTSTDWAPQANKHDAEDDDKTLVGNAAIPTTIVTSGSPEPKECRIEGTPQNCAFARDDLEDEPRRRGKRRKKNRNQTDTATFRPNQDPVTQVATLVPDSPSQSQRPSLATNESVLIPAKKSSQETPPPGKDNIKNSSFLDEEALSLLRRGICVDVIENNFGMLMNAALREAIRSLPFDVDSREPEVVRNVRESLNLPFVNHEKWLTLPRKYTRLVSRFELPIDSTELSKLTPVEYLSRYVNVSNYRKQLYHRIFVKYIPEIKIDELDEREMDREPRDVSDGDDWTMMGEEDVASEYLSQRVIPATHIEQALKTALHPHGTPTTLSTIADKLALSTLDGINFRTWCGIVAFTERFITTIQREVDTRHEIEVTDFESLDRRLNGIDVHPQLKEILYIIRS